MKTVFKILKKVVLIGLGVYAALFAVFFFDLDGKALFYGVEPFLCRHYDRMERRDPLKQKYDMDKPRYEYNKLGDTLERTQPYPHPCGRERPCL